MANVKKSNDKEPGFEKALARLETIVREMEGGALSLEKMMKHFEEGMSLVGVCARQLNEVERKIERLVKQGAQTTLAPFATPAEPAEEEYHAAPDAAEKK
ncbi:MAG: exodeoxyribonuclease VII small subunit [Lentisphaerae bacterium]|nr:exodeoxyribonuclease VII small subunit [Lentisphaerota bacterium]